MAVWHPRRLGSSELKSGAENLHYSYLYLFSDFDGDGKADNISFMIKRIKVHTTDALKDPNYRFPKNYGVEKFLEIFSEEDYDAFCLAYMFTYRDFEGGTLGLAWTGDLKNAGGVCEKNGVSSIWLCHFFALSQFQYVFSYSTTVAAERA